MVVGSFPSILPLLCLLPFLSTGDAPLSQGVRGFPAPRLPYPVFHRRLPPRHQSPTPARFNMPSLGELECQIEEANTGHPFEEHGTLYGDGVVETYIVIPTSPQNFSVRLRSKGYISEGLAALVFMDGEYQCNRNRLNLKPPKRGFPRSATEINFRMRQKEKPVGDGSFIGRDWRFDTHNQSESSPPRCDTVADQ